MRVQLGEYHLRTLYFDQLCLYNKNCSSYINKTHPDLVFDFIQFKNIIDQLIQNNAIVTLYYWISSLGMRSVKVTNIQATNFNYVIDMETNTFSLFADLSDHIVTYSNQTVDVRNYTWSMQFIPTQQLIHTNLNIRCFYETFSYSTVISFCLIDQSDWN